MAKKKPIYLVYLRRPGVQFGLQAVKADTKKEARAKFKKRWPKSTIFSIDKATPETDYIILSHAI